MIDVIVLAIVAVVISLAISYIVKAKKSGAKCIGCPSGCNCSAKNTGEGCDCGCQADNN